MEPTPIGGLSQATNGADPNRGPLSGYKWSRPPKGAFLKLQMEPNPIGGLSQATNGAEPGLIGGLSLATNGAKNP
jgi:hypothetical protein